MATFTGADRAIGFLFDMVRNIAEEYNSSSPYVVGEYAIYSGTLYKCTTAVVSAEAFDPAKWSAVLIMDEIAAGGGGGGTTVIANPSGIPSETLSKLQVGTTIYSIPSGGGGGYSFTVLYQNTDFSIPSGTANITNTYQLTDSIDNYDAVLVECYLYVTSSAKNNRMTMLIHKNNYYSENIDKEWDFLMFADNFSGSTQGRRRIAFGFPSSTSLKTIAQRIISSECPKLNNIIGLKF